MARSPFTRGILDYLPDTSRGPLGVVDPATTLGNVLGNTQAMRQNPQMGQSIYDQGRADAWSGFNATPRMEDGTTQMGSGNAANDIWGAFNTTPRVEDNTPQLGGNNQANTIATALGGQQAQQQATPGARGDGSLFTTPDVEGSFGSTWDGQRWINNPNGVPAGSPVGKTGATLPVAYNAQLDTFRHEFNGQPQEQSRTRVMRWAADNQRLYGMDAQTALNSAMSRLKRDMGENWRQSGFDLTNIQAAPVGQDNFVPPQVAAGQPAAPGVGTPTAGVGVPAAGATGVPTVGTPATGGTGTSTVGGGQNAVNAAIAGDESQQLRILMQSIGISPDDKGIFGRTIQNTLKSILPAYMSLQGFGMAPGQGANPGDNIEQNIRNLGNIFSGTGGFNQYLQNAAAQAKAQLGPGTWASQNLDEAGVLQALGNITNLGTRGLNPLMQNAYKDYYDTAVGNERDYQLDRIRNGQGYGNAADWLRNSRWADLLR